jgi:tryptophanyl-tRNA synthetase
MSGRTVFSGIQPTGSLTLGNYLGALRAWVDLQAQEDCVFCIVDLHALTVAPDPAALRGRSLEFAALCVACGLDPARCILFLQSRVSAHAELAWLLGCVARIGELSRMTQYKEKARRKESGLPVGLFTYPVLMAADILLYDTALVPVGEDQRQHVELAREIAERFNRTYGRVFSVPEALVGATGARIRSLTNPDRKMSKTDEDPMGFVALLDTPDVVRAKVRAAVTGSGRGFHGEDASPGIENLVSIMSALRGGTPAQIAATFEGRGYAQLKEALAEEINAFLLPVQRRFAELRADEAALRLLLHEGAGRASARAAMTLRRAYEAAGLSYETSTVPTS